jgi:hypothetical protein
VIGPYVTLFDKGIEELCCVTTGFSIDPDDLITQGRFFLPRALSGSGMRRQRQICDAAFVGGVLQSAPRMIDSKREDGSVKAGFMPSLTSLLGEGSFDFGNEGHRWDHLIASASPLGVNLKRSWLALRRRAGADDTGEGMLDWPVEAAGSTGVPGVTIAKGAQKKISSEVDLGAYTKLQKAINNLPWDDRRRTAAHNVDRLSSAFLGSIPTDEDLIGNRDYLQAAQDYFGIPSSQMAPHVGTAIKKYKFPLGAYGDELCNAPMGGDGWRTRHDDVKLTIYALLLAADIRASCEVYGLFSACLKQSAEVRGLDRKAAQGLVPDFLIQLANKPRCLYELKTISQGPSLFTAATATNNCGGVLRRASRIHKEYVNKSKKADIKYNNFVSEAGSKGPMQKHLDTFPPVKGLVVGPRGEGSPDLHSLLGAIAAEWAGKSWRSLGTDSVEVAKGLLLNRCVRTVGIVAVRSAARLKGDRLGILLSGSGDGVTPAVRRQAAQRQHDAAHREYAAMYGSGPPPAR